MTGEKTEDEFAQAEGWFGSGLDCLLLEDGTTRVSGA